LQNISAVSELFAQRVLNFCVLSEQLYSRPAFIKQYWSNGSFRSTDTQTRVKDHLPVRTQ